MADVISIIRAYKQAITDTIYNGLIYIYIFIFQEKNQQHFSAGYDFTVKLSVKHQADLSCQVTFANST
jgi:hypothetical protein